MSLPRASSGVPPPGQCGENSTFILHLSFAVDEVAVNLPHATLTCSCVLVNNLDWVCLFTLNSLEKKISEPYKKFHMCIGRNQTLAEECGRSFSLACSYLLIFLIW